MKYRLFVFIGAKPPQISESDDLDALIEKAECCRKEQNAAGFEIWDIDYNDVVAAELWT